ncbi:Ig-like domain-containing protein, partial [Enterobacter sichuanensis]|uniref:Ig-like domain-containing protein n=1 Tax=Enterobacter sichuanensis TaxID=2071710 RepID=UPI0021D00718
MLKGYAKKTLTALLIICLALGNVFVSLPSGIVQAASSSKQAKKITITPKATQQLAIGEKLKLKAVKSPKNAKGKVIWSISNKAIAT